MFGPARPEIGCLRTPKSHATAAYFRIDYTYIVINRASEIVRTRTKYDFSVKFANKNSNKSVGVGRTTHP